MSQTFEFTEEDKARTKIIQVGGWFPVRVTEVEKKASNADQSMNTFFTVKGTAGEANMVEVTTCFNEKPKAIAMSTIWKLFKALNGGKDLQVGEKYQLTPELVGNESLEAFIAPGTIDKAGTIGNTVKDWRPRQG